MHIKVFSLFFLKPLSQDTNVLPQFVIYSDIPEISYFTKLTLLFSAQHKSLPWPCFSSEKHTCNVVNVIWYYILTYFSLDEAKGEAFIPCPKYCLMSNPSLETVWSGTVSLCSLCRIWRGAWHNITLLQQSDNRLARLSTALHFRRIIKNIIHFFPSINSLAEMSGICLFVPPLVREA